MDLRTRAAAVRHGRIYENVEPEFRWEQGESGDSDNVLQINLLGFKKEELKVQVDNQGTLRVSGERQVQGNRWARLRKDFSLPDAYDASEIRAKFGDGVLTILFPKFYPVAYPAEEEQQPALPSEREGRGQREERLPMPSLPAVPEEERKQSPGLGRLSRRTEKEEKIAAGQLGLGPKDRKEPPSQQPPSGPPAVQKLGSVLARAAGGEQATAAPPKAQPGRQTPPASLKDGKEEERRAKAPIKQPALLPTTKAEAEVQAIISPPTGAQKQPPEKHSVAADPFRHPATSDVASQPIPNKVDEAIAKPKVAQDGIYTRPKDQPRDPKVANGDIGKDITRRPTHATPSYLPAASKIDGAANGDNGMRSRASSGNDEGENNMKLVTNIIVAMFVLLCFWSYISYTFKKTTNTN